MKFDNFENNATEWKYELFLKVYQFSDQYHTKNIQNLQMNISITKLSILLTHYYTWKSHSNETKVFQREFNTVVLYQIEFVILNVCVFETRNAKYIYTYTYACLFILHSE